MVDNIGYIIYYFETIFLSRPKLGLIHLKFIIIIILVCNKYHGFLKENIRDFE